MRTRVTVGLRGEREGILLEVGDTGTGIAAEHLPHVFERCCRVGKSRSQEGRDSSLGLAISLALVEPHMGRLVFDFVADNPGE